MKFLSEGCFVDTPQDKSKYHGTIKFSDNEKLEEYGDRYTTIHDGSTATIECDQGLPNNMLSNMTTNQDLVKNILRFLLVNS